MNRRISTLTLFAVLLGIAIWCACEGPSGESLDVTARANATAESTSAAPRLAGSEERSSAGGQSAPVGFYGAPVGRVFSFDFDQATSYSLEALPQQGDQVVTSTDEELSLPFHGVLNMQILQREGDAITVVVQGTEVRASLPADADERGVVAAQSYCDGLTTWFLVTIDTRGTVSGYAFQEGLAPRQRNLARSIVAAFFHTIPATPGASWVATELDTTGEYTADYRLVKTDHNRTEIERVKRSYSSMGPAIGARTALPEHTLSGHSTARFDLNTGWLAAVSVEESMTMDITDFPSRVHLGVTARFEIADSKWRGVHLEKSQWPPFVSACGAGENISSSSEAEEREHWRAKTANLSLEELLAEIRALIEADKMRDQAFYSQWETLAWKLALDPGAVAATEQLLLHGGVDERTGSMLLSALGKAGSTEAQATLLSVYGERGLGDDWRESAAFSMFQLAKPSTDVLQTVSNQVRDLRDVGRLDAANLLLLGTIAPRNTSPLANGKTAMAELVSFERRARDIGATSLWLDALGNAAVPEVAPLASRYLADGDPSIRESAVVALDRSAAPGVTPTLIQIAKRDSSRNVRLRAIEALGKRGSERGRETLRRLAMKASHPDLRIAAIQAMAARGSLEARDRKVLEELARGDAVKEVREGARRALGVRR